MAAIEPARQTRPKRIALIGNPNTGKSTLFNALAGMRARVGNYPGVTVEKKVARLTWDDLRFDLIDLPGTYSLSPRSLDEMVSVDVLLGRQPDIGEIDAVVCIVDAANLERNLYLVSQVLDMRLPTVLVLNMADVARRKGITVDAKGLANRLGMPVVLAEAHRRVGMDDLRDAIVETIRTEHPERSKSETEDSSAGGRCAFPDAFGRECDLLARKLNGTGDRVIPDYLQLRMLLDVGGHVERSITTTRDKRLPEYLEQARQRLREQGCRIPAVEAQVRFAWARQVLDGLVVRAVERPLTNSDRLDRVLTHWFLGTSVFAILMFVLFQALYTWAEPLMNGIEVGQDWVSAQIAMHLGPGAMRSLMIDGVVAGVGAVVVFLPQICLLFLFIAILEDCGYMARAAFLMDKLMTRVGLSGKSFVPLMSSFACAIPGVMATRVIENRRDRMVTILVAPLMSCSARLPVYLLLIGAFVPATEYLSSWITLQGLVLFGFSSLGALVAVPVAWILKKTFFRGETPPFVLELPSYKWPSPGIVFHRVYDRGMAFLVRAGTLIFTTVIVVWGAGYFPGDHEELNHIQTQLETGAEHGLDEATSGELLDKHHQLSGELIAGSYLGRAGHVIAPVVKPLGWDWKIGVGVVASFPAREVIIATLGTIYSLGGDVDESSTGLQAALHAASWPDGRPVYTIPVALSIMVFTALCAQCASTLMVIKRETGSWVWPVFTFTYMTALAYLGAWIVFQVGTRFV